MRLFVTLSIISLSIMTMSCKKEESIGREVQVGNNDISLLTNSSIHITASTVKAKAERTDERFSGMLGAYIDPIFGSNIITYNTQFNLDEEGFSFPTDAIFDSAFVSFRLTGGYREKDIDEKARTQMHFEVHELTEVLDISEIYYSDRVAQTDPTIIGEYNGPVGLYDSVHVNGEAQPAQIRIPLNATWGEKILTADASNFLTNENFVSFMNGFCIKPIQANDPNGSGAIFYFNPLSAFTGVTIHYHTSTDTTKFSFVSNSLTANYMNFEHDYSSSTVGGVIGDTNVGSDILYLQSTIGTDIEIELKEIAAQFAQNSKIINIAELYIPVDTNQAFYPLDKLSVSRKMESGTAEFLPDQVETGNRVIDGNLNADSSYYRFLITQYVQEVIQSYTPGSNKSEKLLISPFGNNILANRSVITGPRPKDANANRMKIVITYTPLN